MPCQKSEGHNNLVYGAIHLPGGQRIMTCSRDGSLRVWNMKTGKQIGDDWRDGESEVWTIVLSPDGKKVVSGSEDGGLLMSNERKSMVTLHQKFEGHAHCVYGAIHLPGGQPIMTFSADNSLRVWNVKSGKQIGKFEGHSGLVYGAIPLPGGQRIMTCSSDGSVRVWNLKTGKQIGEDWRDGDSEVWIIALSPDGKKAVSGSMDGGVRLWYIDTGKVITKWMGHTDGVTSVCWSRDGQRILSGSIDGTARQWKVENEETILAPVKTGHRYVFAAVYSPDMSMFATGGSEQSWDFTGDNESQIKIWDVKIVGKLVATLEGHTHRVWCLAWTPDGKTLISGSSDRSIRTWNTTTWKQIALLDEHTDHITDIAISPSGRILASTSNDNTARLWNLDNNQPISSPLHHASRVDSVSFSADGRLLSTGCWDTNAYTWDVSALVKEAGLDELLFDQHDKSVNSDTRRRPVRQPIKLSGRVPQGFFDDLPDHAHVSARHRHHPRSWASRASSLRDGFSSLFRPTHANAHDTPSQPRPFHWVRNRLSGRPSGVAIELHERPSAVVVVPHCQAKRRNALGRNRRRPIISLKSKKPVASTSNSNITQSSSAAQPHSSQQLQVAISTSSTAPLPVPAPQATTSHTNPHATINNSGCWTRFWLFVCCASSEYTHN
ncbi:tricorn protease domain 2-containing protein [Suillus decipiens]|nr:tricorn protease domain 2-containing protein [Suillus decipiens]